MVYNAHFSCSQQERAKQQTSKTLNRCLMNIGNKYSPFGAKIVYKLLKTVNNVFNYYQNTKTYSLRFGLELIIIIIYNNYN